MCCWDLERKKYTVIWLHISNAYAFVTWICCLIYILPIVVLCVHVYYLPSSFIFFVGAIMWMISVRNVLLRITTKEMNAIGLKQHQLVLKCVALTFGFIMFTSFFVWMRSTHSFHNYTINRVSSAISKRIIVIVFSLCVLQNSFICLYFEIVYVQNCAKYCASLCVVFFLYSCIIVVLIRRNIYIRRALLKIRFGINLL